MPDRDHGRATIAIAWQAKFSLAFWVNLIYNLLMATDAPSPPPKPTPSYGDLRDSIMELFFWSTFAKDDTRSAGLRKIARARAAELDKFIVEHWEAAGNETQRATKPGFVRKSN